MGPEPSYKWDEMGPIYMAENKWVTEVITLLFKVGFEGGEITTKSRVKFHPIYPFIFGHL